MMKGWVSKCVNSPRSICSQTGEAVSRWYIDGIGMREDGGRGRMGKDVLYAVGWLMAAQSRDARFGPRVIDPFCMQACMGRSLAHSADGELSRMPSATGSHGEVGEESRMRPDASTEKPFPIRLVIGPGGSRLEASTAFLTGGTIASRHRDVCLASTPRPQPATEGSTTS
jgi:hypothetical protein